ncbi:Zn(II)2Cys6 transcription factor [Aspergillus mulundensis]|uniref:Zn(2)-C6 fungal-type domain-containing protein n=1 Tax=Aspergillus mulundensis TaxID=1810919 RepID=A0A3D8S4N6_9EURO|nr:hypothetical protein DSM5745_04820 [Aspergillus mulundensis]RDW81263.1 hypothetical protein DSM5745_04820 [Aspergillus mulundensis]
MSQYETREFSRVAIACETCRKRKRKCDGAQPKCSWCLAKDTECHYITERPAKRKLDRDYVAGLEDQIALLKEEVRRLENLNPTATRPEHIASILAEDSELGQKRQGQGQRADETLFPSTTTAIDDVSALMWRMNIESSGETTLIGPSGNFCFPVPHADAFEDDSRLHSGEAACDRPSKETDRLGIITRLLDDFTRFINPIHQFLDKETLTTLRKTDLSEGLALIKTAAMAAGSLYSDNPECKAMGDEAATMVDAMIIQACRENPSVSTVQTLSIMSWRELGLEQHNMGWMYNSMAGSMALHLGLSSTSVHEAKSLACVDGVTANNVPSVRLRALWSTVFMDRVATCLLGRTCMLPWRRIQASPFLDSLGSSPSLDELVFDHHCRLWFIFDQYMDRIYSFEFGDLSSEERYRLLLDAREHLLSFQRQLHSQLQLSKAKTVPSVIFLQMTMNMAQILIHRPYLKESAQSNAYWLSVRTMSTAASGMVRLIREYRKVGAFDQVPPFVVHSVLTAAVTHLLNATSSNSTLRSRSIARFRVCFDALGAMQQRWTKARRAIRLLRGLARRWQIMAALPLQNGFDTPVPAETASDSALSGTADITVVSESCVDDLNLADFSAPGLFPDLAASFDIADIMFYQGDGYDAEYFGNSKELP